MIENSENNAKNVHGRFWSGTDLKKKQWHEAFYFHIKIMKM